MKTFHVQLPFQAATDSYPIHHAGSSNTEGNYMLKGNNRNTRARCE